MFRLFQHSDKKNNSASPSLLSTISNTLNPKNLLELSPLEFTYPSLTNIIFTSTLLLQWIPAKAGECWIHNDVPYFLGCSPLFNGELLNGMLEQLVNVTCSNFSFTNQSDCQHLSNYTKFGSDFYSFHTLCNLQYPTNQTPDTCVIDVLNNNTPTGVFSLGDVIVTTFTATNLILLGVFGGVPWLYNKLKNKAEPDYQLLLEDTNEPTALRIN